MAPRCAATGRSSRPLRRRPLRPAKGTSRHGRGRRRRRRPARGPLRRGATIGRSRVRRAPVLRDRAQIHDRRHAGAGGRTREDPGGGGRVPLAGQQRLPTAPGHGAGRPHPVRTRRPVQRAAPRPHRHRPARPVGAPGPGRPRRLRRPSAHRRRPTRRRPPGHAVRAAAARRRGHPAGGHPVRPRALRPGVVLRHPPAAADRGHGGRPGVLDLVDLEDHKIAARMAIPTAAAGPADRAGGRPARAFSAEEVRRWRRLQRSAGQRVAATVVCSDLDAERAVPAGAPGRGGPERLPAGGATRSAGGGRPTRPRSCSRDPPLPARTPRRPGSWSTTSCPASAHWSPTSGSGWSAPRARPVRP